MSLCTFMETQPAAASLELVSISHLDFFKVESRLAVFTVKSPGLTFSLIVAVLVRDQDGGVAGLALNSIKLALAFMLSLKQVGQLVNHCNPTVCVSHAGRISPFIILQLSNQIMTVE